MGTPAGMGGVRGVTAPGATEAGVATAGQDIRHRGWYWHWNTLITQYAPLLGLKGVGLLNSYTVWTDRREGSPHQGYAFPTQDAEGKFYGEGREELITLNKILVALDLIAIHKEMVLRQDDRNRRWRVPHNFYRVKDPRDGLVLNMHAVVRVLELADRDRNVFRHVRHIFGPQFAPIDRTSIWHYLLPELRQLPLWQQLAERAERERRGGKRILSLPTTENPSTSVASDEVVALAGDIGKQITPLRVAIDAIPFDNGIALNAAIALRTDGVDTVDAENTPEVPDVAPVNTDEPSAIDEGKTGVEYAPPPFVVPTDRTEDQEPETREETSTSTSSTSTRESVSDIFAALAERDRRERMGDPIPEAPDAASVAPFLPAQPLPPVPAMLEDGAVVVRALDVTDPPVNAVAHQTASITDIEAALTMANGRPPSDMEISLLVQVARECDPAAQSQGYGPGTGLGWVLTAIWEAVNSGSQFVAPKRVAAICDRWVVEGFGSDNRANPAAPPTYAPPPDWPVPDASAESSVDIPSVARSDPGPIPTIPALPDISYASAPPATMPGTTATDAEGRRLWEQVIRRLDGVLHPDALERWFTSARVTAIDHDRVTVTVPGADIALKLASYRGLISRRMSEALGRTVDVVFQATRLSASPTEPPAPSTPPSNTVQQSTQVYSSRPTSPTASGSFPVIPAEFTQPKTPPAVSTLATASNLETPPMPPSPTSAPTKHPAAGGEPSVAPPTVPTFALTSAGLSNQQIWTMALQDLRARMSSATFAVWIRPAELLAIDPDGTLVIGARNRVQRERLERQHLADIVAALNGVLDRPVGVRVVVIGESDLRGGGEQQQHG